MKHRKKLLALAALPLLAACTGQDASKTDLDEPEFNGDVLPSVYEAVTPDAIQVFFNVDNHPNLVRLCIDDLAFVTVSATHQAWTPAYDRIPEWDPWCAAQ